MIVSNPKPKIRIVEDPKELAQVAADEFKRLANLAVESKGSFNVALSGGSTPKAMFDLLSSDRYKDTIPWLKTHFFWGDERHVPPDDEDSNYRMTKEHLLSKIPILPENIHRVEAENSNAEEVAANYQKHLGSRRKLKLPKREKRVELSISSKAQKVNAAINRLFKIASNGDGK